VISIIILLTSYFDVFRLTRLVTGAGMVFGRVDPRFREDVSIGVRRGTG
jgi:hypothetical protein